jgi:AraC family transcriptional regulator, melibiose operon regulatory protein
MILSNIIIPVDNDLNTTLIIGSEDFPFELFHDNLKNFSNGFVNWHKQKQIEISVVLEGSVKLNTLEKEIIVRAGDGFLILPGRLHAVKPNINEPAKYFTLIFDTIFLTEYKGSFFEKEYYSEIINVGESFYQFKKESDWTKSVFDQLIWIYNNYPDTSVKYKLAVQRKLQDLWIILYNNLISRQKCEKPNPQNMRIQQMIEYLHQNYTDKFSLSDMAAYHNVSRGECCRFFKRMMNMTISDYLMEYRISKSVELLENTNLSITEISQAVGFSSLSYYIASFKEKMSCSPLSFRNTAHTI